MSVEPMLRQLAQDQFYRRRWLEERDKSRAKWARYIGWTIASLSGIAVVAASAAELVHLL